MILEFDIESSSDPSLSLGVTGLDGSVWEFSTMKHIILDFVLGFPLISCMPESFISSGFGTHADLSHRNSAGNQFGFILVWSTPNCHDHSHPVHVFVESSGFR